METNVEFIIEKVIHDHLFSRLKGVVENNSYHNHEDVYSHLIKTKDIAQREISGKFITNPEAKKLFLEFINEDFHGMKRADIMILIALLHDIGKILSVREGRETHSILVTDSSGITLCPGHEYWGSTIVGEVLQGVTLKSEVITYIANVVKLHDTFSEGYMTTRKEWPLQALINDVQSRADGFYKETMFNIYCDCFTAPPYQFAKEIIIKLFNELELYEKREYTIQ